MGEAVENSDILDALRDDPPVIERFVSELSTQETPALLAKKGDAVAFKDGSVIERFVPTPSAIMFPVPLGKKDNTQEKKSFWSRGWSLLLPLTSLHFGGGDEDQNKRYNAFNLGLGVQKEFAQIGKHLFSVSVGAYLNSFYATPDQDRLVDDAPTVTPYVFFDYSYDFNKFSCGASVGLVDYHGNLPATEISDRSTIGYGGQFSCAAKIVNNWSVQVGVVPVSALVPDLSSVGTMVLKYSFD